MPNHFSRLKCLNHDGILTLSSGKKHPNIILKCQSASYCPQKSPKVHRVCEVRLKSCEWVDSDILIIFYFAASGTLITVWCYWWTALLWKCGHEHFHISDFWLLSSYPFSIISLWKFPGCQHFYSYVLAGHPCMMRQSSCLQENMKCDSSKYTIHN